MRTGELKAKRMGNLEESMTLLLLMVAYSFQTMKITGYTSLQLTDSSCQLGVPKVQVMDNLTNPHSMGSDPSSIDPDKWCSCIDGALTKENYITSIKKGGFDNVEVLDEKLYTEGDQVDNRRITSLVIKAVKE